MGKKLYLTDLDGTLLNRESTVSCRSRDIINSLINSGTMFTYATARSYNSAKIVTDGLSVKLPIIVFNGAFIYDISKDKFLHSSFFKESDILFFMDLSRLYGFTPLVYTFIGGTEKILWNKNGNLSSGFLYYLSKRKNDKRMCAVESLEESFSGEIFYITFIDDYEKLLPMYRSIESIMHFNCIFQQELYRKEYWCEIMPESVDKASAACRLKSILKCDELIVFGDSLNDIPMFKIADRSYAVMNANDRLKQIATEVIGYNYDDSVAVKLSEIEGLDVTEL